MSHPHPVLNVANLRLASRGAVVQTLSRFVGKPVAQWLPNTHAAHTAQFLNATGNPYTRYTTFTRDFDKQDVVDVLAASGPSHCLDGWTFLSRALSALLSGDTHTARHLAYYAQLRAALSHLHCHGIGIFNGLNFVVDLAGDLHRIDNNSPNQRGLGTHRAAWEALREWAGHASASREFLSAFLFRGVSLVECIDAIWPSAPPAPLISEVVETWGVDLKRSAKEHESRNISSYAAQAFNPSASSLPDRLDLVESIWNGLEPDGGGGFPVLDRHLLRRFLELMKSEQAKITRSHLAWGSAFPRLDPKVQTFVTKEFLERIDQPSDLVVLKHASSTTPGDVHAMICRALLLLRCATAVVRSAFVDAQFDLAANDLQPWFDTVGLDRGFWSPSQPPPAILDLWDVVAYAVEDLVGSRIVDQSDFLDSLSSQSVYLSQAERACIWGVGG